MTHRSGMKYIKQFVFDHVNCASRWRLSSWSSSPSCWCLRFNWCCAARGIRAPGEARRTDRAGSRAPSFANTFARACLWRASRCVRCSSRAATARTATPTTSRDGRPARPAPTRSVWVRRVLRQHQRNPKNRRVQQKVCCEHPYRRLQLVT